MKKIFIIMVCCIVFSNPCFAKQLTSIDCKEFLLRTESLLKHKAIETFELYKQHNGYDIYKVTFDEWDNNSRMYLVLQNNEFVQIMFVNVSEEAESITYNKIIASLRVLGFSEKQANDMMNKSLEIGNY